MVVRRYLPNKLRGLVFLSLVVACAMTKHVYTTPASIAWAIFWLFFALWMIRGVWRWLRTKAVPVRIKG
jgi:hypothetical protein